MARAILVVPSTSVGNFPITYTNATANTVTAQYNLLAAGLAGTDGVLSGVYAKPGQIIRLLDPAVFDSNNKALNQNVSASTTLPVGTASQITDSITPNIARVGPAGHLQVTDGGMNSTAVAAGVTSDTVIKASAGRVCKVLITTLGTNSLTICDNATAGSGKVIGFIAASAAAGTIVSFQMPAANGITILGNTNNPAFTIGWQ